MEDTIEIKSNMAGYLEHIRNGVMFQDAGTVLDELIQNSQRSHSDNIHISVHDDILTVWDDGDGCPDPQLLFESNTSGWVDKPEAFGEGFFSVFYLGSVIDVRSHDWAVRLDVDNIINSGNMSVDNVQTGLKYMDGFSISIVGERVREYSGILIDRAESLGKLCIPIVYVNTAEVSKTDLLALDKKHSIMIRNDVFDAVMFPYTWSDSEVYYEGRKVCDQYLCDIGGNIVLKTGGVTLKAPDRKAIVQDDKKNRMENLLKEGAKITYKNLISEATDADLNKYSSGIDKWLEVEEYAPLLPVSNKIIVNSDMGGWMDLSGVGTALAEASSGNHLKKDALKNVIDAAGGRVAYVESFDAERMQQEISQAEYEGITIMYSVNSLYKKAYKYYGVKSLKEFLNSTKKIPIIENDGPINSSEERFLFLMQRVEDKFGIVRGTIHVADVGIDMVRDDGTVVDSKRNSIRGMYVPDSKSIYMDRATMDLDQFSLSSPTSITISVDDRRMLSAEQYVLCHELCHMIYSTSDSSPSHDSLMADVNREFARAF